MNKILQHVVPAGFHRTRHYGLHAANTRKRLGSKLEKYVKGAPDTVAMLVRIVKALLRAQLQLCCKGCGSTRLPVITAVVPDSSFIRPYLKGVNRAPPVAAEHPEPKLVAA